MRSKGEDDWGRKLSAAGRKSRGQGTMGQVQGEEDFPMLARDIGSCTQLVAIGVRRPDGVQISLTEFANRI